MASALVEMKTLEELEREARWRAQILQQHEPNGSFYTWSVWTRSEVWLSPTHWARLALISRGLYVVLLWSRQNDTAHQPRSIPLVNELTVLVFANKNDAHRFFGQKDFKQYVR